VFVLAGVQVLDPYKFGFPIDRKRKYMLFLLHTLRLTTSISDLVTGTMHVFPKDERSFHELLFDWDIEHEMREADTSTVESYRRIFGEVLVADVRQNPIRKPRKTLTNKMFTLTTGRTFKAKMGIFSGCRPFSPLHGLKTQAFLGELAVAPLSRIEN
jgi:hypothetical protein